MMAFAADNEWGWTVANTTIGIVFDVLLPKITYWGSVWDAGINHVASIFHIPYQSTLLLQVSN